MSTAMRKTSHLVAVSVAVAVGLLCTGLLVETVLSFAVASPLPRGSTSGVSVGATESKTFLAGVTSRGLNTNSNDNFVLAGGAALVALAAAGALIVQNKGGGHGEIGYHLALNLANEKGLKVTMINDSAAKKEKPPFSNYSDLEAAGVEVRWANLEEGGLAAAMEGIEPCEYVFDNQNVCPKDVQSAVKAWNPKAYAYVSSGGMYKPVKEGGMLETGDVKEDNKQLSIEKSAADAGLNWSAYRPQYIYGPKTNKRDYLDWFLDRITRDVSFPLPGDGSFRTTLTNAEDVAGMLASVVGKEDAAKQQVFNCAADVLVSHKEIVEIVAKTVGKDPQAVMKKVVFYDPAALKGVELPKKGKFPFREMNFGVDVQKAKNTLGWAPKHSLEGDIASYFEEYKRLGKDTGDIVSEWDEAVIKAVGA
eukprot:TRINITY_DN6546_c2_g1_i1.p1 TRINITY_DN6546_c2_g1~~TRINITY_DN6546_c2_g1_i1.p1  ORF type:complete len:420 (+),score=105.59 TRINITY_DN6546_c2_g1_i1:73-1332(+)